jgi:hypothetical protein
LTSRFFVPYDRRVVGDDRPPSSAVEPASSAYTGKKGDEFRQPSLLVLGLGTAAPFPAAASAGMTISTRKYAP